MKRVLLGMWCAAALSASAGCDDDTAVHDGAVAADLGVADLSAADGPAPSSDLAMDVAHQIAGSLAIHFAVVENGPLKADGKTPDCPANAPWGLCLRAKIVVENKGASLQSGDFSIFYSSIRKVLSVENPEFTITHLNGDLHQITPTAQFKGFQAGETKEIVLTAEYWMISETDVMPRFYVVAPGSTPAPVANTDTEALADFVAPFGGPKQTLRTPGDHSVPATAATRFAENATVQDHGQAAVVTQIVPTPVSLTVGTGTLDLTAGVTFAATGLSSDTLDAVTARLVALGLHVVPTGGVPVKVSVNAQDPAFVGKSTAEAYTLRIDGASVTLVGGDAAGAGWALQTLAALLPADGGIHPQVPQLTIPYDAPRYPVRGVQLDLARNFHGVAAVTKVIEQMAAYKLNLLHLHLSDDEGWRVEIPGLPELTTVGSQRCHDLTEKTCLLPQLGSGPTAANSGSGYLTRAELVGILRAARARNIEVVPEFDMPGHVRAGIKSMEARAANGDASYLLSDPQDTSHYSTAQSYTDDAINGCLESTYKFVAKVMDEVKAMYTEAGAPLRTWHTGGDEVGDGAWTGSPACAQLYQTSSEVKSAADVHGYFIRRVNALAKARSLGLRGWSDGMRKSVPGPNNQPQKVFLDPKTDLDGNAVSTNWWGTLFWWDNSAYELANKGFKVILTNPDFLYFDHPYEDDPHERGYYWATRSTSVRKLFSFMPGNLPANSQLSVDRMGDSYQSLFQPTAMTPQPVIPLTAQQNVVGLEGALWGETVRTDGLVDYMVFPRLLALAERAWHRADWEPADGTAWDATIDKTRLAADWERFANLLGYKELPKLGKAGVQYRVEVPGARIVNGKLEVNVAFPGLGLEYRDANGTWTAYDAAHPPTIASTEVRARTSEQRVGRSVSVP
jgi:hexosaminidase